MRRHLAWLTLSLLCTGAATAQQPERFTLSGPQVAIFNLAGEVRIERGSGTDVVVEVLRQGRDADELTIRSGDLAGWRALHVVYPDDRIVYPRMGRFSRSEFDLDSDGNIASRMLRVTMDESGFTIPSGRSAGGRRKRVRVTGSGSGLEAYADLRVLVPEGRTVALHLGVGRVNVAHVAGHVRVDARSGSVTASDVAGSLLLYTGSGSVNAAGVRGHVRIDTGSGSVRADDISGGTLVIDTGSGGVDASVLDVLALDIDTGSGGIRLDHASAPELRLNTGSGGIRASRVRARDLDLDTGSGSIALELLSDIRNARLNTGSGGITLDVPSELGAQFVFDTGSGGIDVDGPLTISEKRRTHLRGALGDGQGRLTVGTGSGGVRVRTR